MFCSMFRLLLVRSYIDVFIAYFLLLYLILLIINGTMEQIAINIDIATLFAVTLFKNTRNKKRNWNKTIL